MLGVGKNVLLQITSHKNQLGKLLKEIGQLLEREKNCIRPIGSCLWD